jgi:hypothetical protein
MSRILNSNLHSAADSSLEPADELASSIGLFRAAMHSIAKRETARPVASDWLMPARQRRRRAQRRMVLAWSCAAALSLAILPRSYHTQLSPHPLVAAQHPSAAPSDNTDTSDTALLEQVDNAISEPVPSSLAPLNEMDSWNSTTSTTHTEKKNVPE